MKNSLKLALSLGILFAWHKPAPAQIVPDATLPVNSIVTPTGNTFLIEGGSSVGSNLFHSFREFSLGTGDRAIFNNSLTIQNILTRITGTNISNIDGLIAANGKANLFLINPNGIIFGPNAKLNIGGSFFASTADSIALSDGSFFSAKNPNAPPLLTINVPVGLQMGENPGKIQVLGEGHQLSFDSNTLATVRTSRPAGLQVLPGKTLGLLGGDIELIGGNITAEGGIIELGSVSNNLVTLTPIPEGFAFGYENVQNFQNIRLSQAASASTSGNGGGDIQMQARRLEILEGSTILADTLGTANGGTLSVKTTEAVEIIGSPDNFSSSIFASVDPGATGGGGSLSIETPNLLLGNGAIVGADTFGQGNAGALTVRARNVELSAATVMETAAYGGSTGNAGNLTIETGRLVVSNGAQILTFTRDRGNAGDLTVKAQEVEVRGVSSNGRFSSVLAASAELGSTGKGGQLTIETSSLKIAEGAKVGVDTAGSNPAGQVRIKAENLEIYGTAFNGSPSILSADTFSTGNGGELNIEAKTLIVRDGAQIATGTFDKGTGGNLIINASNIELSGATPTAENLSRDFFKDQSGQLLPSGLFASSFGSGNAGTLSVTAGSLRITDRAQISVSSQQGGEAGNLNIIARSLFQDKGTLSAATVQGKQGNITLNIGALQLRNGSAITTNASGESTGGNISLSAETLTALENSDISANSQEARGGQVTINVQGIFGTEYRLFPTPKSDITASGGSPELSGNVQINTPNANPAAGLGTLPSQLSDLSNQIVQGCAASQGNRFVVTGRGGLPDDPSQPLTSQMIWQDMRPLETTETVGDVVEKEPVRGGVFEANSWRLNSRGQVELIVSNAGFQKEGFWYKWPRCRV
ncbi:filamentous hemagglutinin N-terminal domain-containing protein [Ancylothrix sp. C2]|uniref:two-partner secretion domain-containing protein n=1 Tax=Ancylothrix sp. D3o TaxID=2953691 RepID=UPI0021BAF3D6|nr:filamentous hemagglutinin N-terminal domain-containing protein [Ancylothrix sp. D3o]MCT7950341.1 filamentous hemagglutinin N-terminal domain-containing protein [Ancylothrix sp. D3o]